MAETESKSWKEEEEEESASLLADGNVFYGGDGKPSRKGAAGRTAGTLKELSGGQDMAYIDQSRSANTKSEYVAQREEEGTAEQLIQGNRAGRRRNRGSKIEWTTVRPQ